MNKRKKLLIKASIIVLVIIVLLWVMPGRVKRYFPNYFFFSAISKHAVYPNVLPLSAHNLRYYNFEFFFITKNGYKATLAEADYEKIKTRQWEIYSHGLPNDHHLYDGKNKLYLNKNEVYKRGVDFLDDLLPPEEDDGQYYFLAYSYCDGGGSYYTYSGVLCNDEKHEILEFTYRYVPE